MLEIATHQQPMLGSIANLFRALHESDISYCSLKGNDQHLVNALTGQSDIDILFDKSEKEKLNVTLRALGYKEFISIREKQFKDIGDYFILDEASGKMIHLHAHFAVTFGEPFLKGYQVGVAQHILATRVYNDDYGLYCIQPAIELVLLYLTEALKLRHRDAIRHFLKKDLSPGKKAVYQYNWLARRTTPDEIGHALHAMFPGANALTRLIGSPFDSAHLGKLAPRVKRSLSAYRLYPPMEGLLTRWWREMSVVMRRKLAGVLRLPVPYTRLNPRGGKVIALLEHEIGTRTILIHALKETFARKINVYQVTFNNESTPDGPTGHPLARSVRGLSRACLYWLRAKQIDMARRNGALVIYDLPANGGAPARQSGKHRGGNLIRFLAWLQTGIESSAKRLSAPDAVFQFISQGVPWRSSDTIPPSTEGGYTVLTVGPEHSVAEKLNILKREIWNHL